MFLSRCVLLCGDVDHRLDILSSARNHTLSQYNPACRTCGLILCEINLPYYTCPHCASPLLQQDAVGPLIASLEDAIADTLAKEEQARDQAIEEARKAAGAFPALASANASTTSLHSNSGANTPPSSLDAHPVNQSHKVLSLNAKTKRVTVASYTTPSRLVGKSPGRETPTEPEPIRVPRPPQEVLFFSQIADSSRPWINARSSDLVYIPPPKEPSSSEASQSKRKKKGPKTQPSQSQATSGSRDGKENTTEP